MNSYLSKVGFVSVSVTCLSFLVITHSADAASFEFVFQDHETALEKGTLSFAQSPLTGIGIETAKYSQLTDASLQYFFFSNLVPNATVYAGSSGDASFTFNNGNLIGMNFVSFPGDVDFTSTGGSQYYSIKGTGELKVSGNSYQEFFTGTEDFNGTIKESNNALVSSGGITFTTLDPVPVQPIPEPLTMLGAATALSFGTLFKKSLSGNKKSG